MKTAQKIPTIKEFLSNLELGFDFLQTAGEQLCKMKADDFDVFDRITDTCDWITRDMLETLLLIGRKEIHPRIMLLPKHVYSKVCGLPYEEQCRIVSEKVVVPPVSNGAALRAEEIEMSKHAKDLSRSEANRIWTPGRKPTYAPPSESFDLHIEHCGEAQVGYIEPAKATNRKPQIITLDEHGCAVVQFRKKLTERPARDRMGA